MLDRLLPRGSRARQIAFWVAGFALLLIVTQFVMPGRGGGGRGTPMAIVFGGFVRGLVSALTAAGIILVYRTSRIINFAQGAIGAAGGAFVFDMVQFHPGVPFIVDFVLGLLLAGIVGVIVDLVFGRRFFRAPRLVLTVVTIAVADFLASSSAPLILKLPFFPHSDTLTIDALLGSSSLRNQLPFAGWSFHVGKLPIPFGFPELFAIDVAIVGLLALAAFFRFTRAGVAVRAMAENTERASLLGIGVGLMSTIVWALAGVLSGASITLTGALTTPSAGAGLAPAVLLPALAAAVFGRMRSLPVTVASAVGISILVESANWSFNRDAVLIPVGLLAAICIGLLVQRRQILRSEAAESSSWEATAELRPVPKELQGIGTVRLTRYALIAVGVLFFGFFPFVSSAGSTNLMGIIAITAIIGLSLVVLTGWAGQVSLGQYGFAAVGGAVAAGLTQRAGIPFWFAVPIASAIAGAVGILIGLPALRIKGLFLLVTTFAFGIAAPAVMFETRYFGWLLPKQVNRPSLFFFDFEDEKSMYFLCFAALALVILVLVNLRRTRFGRALIAMRENETNVQSFGISVVRMKLSAFALSGAMAGFAGAIFVHQQRGLSAPSFTIAASLSVFIFTVIGGIGTPAGALLGIAYFKTFAYFVHDPLLQTYFGAGGTLYILYAAPGGFMAVLTKLRDAALRVIAQRRQIVVPSLFADYDPDALSHKLIPLAEPYDNAGLAALPAAQRFALASELYRGRGQRLIERLAGPKETEEAAALAAARASAEVSQSVSPEVTS